MMYSGDNKSSTLPSAWPPLEPFAKMVNRCIDCSSERQFIQICDGELRTLFPYGQMLAIIGALDIRKLRTHYEIFVGTSGSAAALITKAVNIEDRLVVQRWINTRKPQVIEPTDYTIKLSDLERQEATLLDMKRICVHGSLDIYGRSGSYFSFWQVQPTLTAVDAVRRMETLVPYLHLALVSCYRPLNEPVKLSPTEMELLQWIALGRTNLEIARLRTRSIATVRNQIHSIYGKLGVANRAEAVNAARTFKLRSTLALD